MERSEALRQIDGALSSIARLAATRDVRLRRERTAGVSLEDSNAYILRTIADRGPLRLGQLSEAVDLEASQLSKKVRRLVDSGLVDHEVDPSERRAILLRVTPEGRRVLRRYREGADRILAGALAEWTDGDLAEAAAVLERLSATFHAASSRGAPSAHR